MALLLQATDTDNPSVDVDEQNDRSGDALMEMSDSVSAELSQKMDIPVEKQETSAAPVTRSKKNHPAFRALRIIRSKRSFRIFVSDNDLRLQIMKKLARDACVYICHKKKGSCLWMLTCVFESEDEANQKLEPVRSFVYHQQRKKHLNQSNQSQCGNPDNHIVGYVHLNTCPPVQNLVFLSCPTAALSKNHIFQKFPAVISVVTVASLDGDESSYAWLMFTTLEESQAACAQQTVDINGIRCTLWMINFTTNSKKIPVDVQGLLKVTASLIAARRDSRGRSPGRSGLRSPRYSRGAYNQSPQFQSNFSHGFNWPVEMACQLCNIPGHTARECYNRGWGGWRGSGRGRGFGTGNYTSYDTNNQLLSMIADSFFSHLNQLADSCYGGSISTGSQYQQQHGQYYDRPWFQSGEQQLYRGRHDGGRMSGRGRRRGGWY